MNSRQPTPLPCVLVFTGLASLGTGVFWFGMAFIAHYGYGFGQSKNLLFHALLGAVYIVGSLGSGPWTHALRGRLSTRAQLAWILVGLSISAGLPIALDGEWVLWIAACLVSILSGWMWPIIESYIAAQRQGDSMRNSIAGFNLVWMPATMAPMFLMAPLVEHNARMSLALLVAASLACLLVLPGFRNNPKQSSQGNAPDEKETGGASEDSDHPVAPEFANSPPSQHYRQLLRSARYLLPTSYVLLSVISPLLPYQLDRLGVPVHWQTPVTATWMAARVLALLVMWRLPIWHGRWSALLVAGSSMMVGLTITVLAPNLLTLLLGLTLLGIGIGVAYCLALYYAMTVGHGDVEAAGTHEALIGLGYTIGPLAGVAGMLLGGPTAVVVISLAISGIACGRAWRPFAEERNLAKRSGIPR